MPLRVKCPAGHKLIVPDDRAGKLLRCPRCSQAFTAEAGQPLGSSPLPDATVPAEPVNAAAVDMLLAGMAKGSPPTKEPPTTPKEPVRPAAKESPPPQAKPPAAVEPAIPPKAAIPATPAPKPAPPPLPPKPAPPPIPAPKMGIRKPPSSPATPPVATPTPPNVEKPAEIVAPPIVSIPADPPPRPSPTLPPPPTPLPPTEPIDPPIAVKPPETKPSRELPQVAQPPPAPPPPPPTAKLDEPPPVQDEAPPRASESVLETPAAIAPAPDLPPPPVPAAPEAPALQRTAARPEPHRLPAVYALASSLIAAAAFSLVPAVWDAVEYMRIPDSQFVARWAFLSLALGLVQAAYGVYLFQLPDWTSVWIVTLYCLGLAGMYAMLAGLLLLASDGSRLIELLELGDKLAGNKAVLWCLCMVSVSVILAFFAGKLSVQWHRAETLLRRAGL